MSLIQNGEPIIIKRRTANGVDSHGNPTFATQDIVLRHALIAIGTTSESMDPERTAYDAKVTIYVPRGTDIQEGDRFLIRNSLWEKDGSPEEWVSPFPSGSDGVVVPLRRRRG